MYARVRARVLACLPSEGMDELAHELAVRASLCVCARVCVWVHLGGVYVGPCK